MTAPRPRPKAVLLDVEGTTTSVRFVYEVLFPYARERVAAFLAERGDDPEVRRAVDLLRAGDPLLAGGDPEAPDVVASVHRQMDEDRKSTGLKLLQGLVWREGYRSGRLRGHVFEDVPEALRRWDAAGIRVAIYSSGSVEAQRLLFRHSDAGDLTPLLAGHFDTTTGPKKAPESYRAIAAALELAAGDVLFVTDVLAEADAARDAGLEVAVSVRLGNAPLPERHPFPVVHDLLELAP